MKINVTPLTVAELVRERAELEAQLEATAVYDEGILRQCEELRAKLREVRDVLIDQFGESEFTAEIDALLAKE